MEALSNRCTRGFSDFGTSDLLPTIIRVFSYSMRVNVNLSNTGSHFNEFCLSGMQMGLKFRLLFFFFT